MHFVMRFRLVRVVRERSKEKRHFQKKRKRKCHVQSD